DLDAIARSHGAKLRCLMRRLADEAIRLIRRVAHALEALGQIGAGLLAAPQPLPLLVDRAPDVPDHALGLVAAQEPGALGFSPLDHRGALGLAPIPIVQAREELLQLTLLGRAIAVRPLDQPGGQAQ